MILIALRALIAFVLTFAMWLLHCNLESNVTPKILIAFLEIMNLPFIFTTIGAQSCRENRHKSVLASLTTIPDCVNHRMILSSFVFILSANLVCSYWEKYPIAWAWRLKVSFHWYQTRWLALTIHCRLKGLHGRLSDHQLSHHYLPVFSIYGFSFTFELNSFLIIVLDFSPQ